MGILRADLLTHSQLEPSGSVFFDGNSDYLSWSNDSVKVGTSDFTLEAWIYAESDTGQHQTIFMAGDSSDAGEIVLQWIRTGSGSALVAYYYTKRQVDNAKKKFRKDYKKYWCIISKTI